MVFAFLHSVRIWKQHQLGVGVHGYVGFNGVFVVSDKASHCFHFRLRLWVGSTVCLLAFRVRCSWTFNQKKSAQFCSFTFSLLHFCSWKMQEYATKEQSMMLLHKKSWVPPCCGKNSHACSNF